MDIESPSHNDKIVSSAAPRPLVITETPFTSGVNTPIPRVTGWTFVMGAFVSIGGVLFGYDTGQISGFQEMDNYLERYGELGSSGEYSFGHIRAGLIVGLLSIGTLIGALCGAPIADKLGRKWSITLWCIILNIGLVVQISAPGGKWYQMVIGRWVTGLGIGGCSLVVPMYQGESAPRHVRGAIICCYQLFVTFGIFLSYLLNLGTRTLNNTGQWRISLGLTFAFALVLGGGMVFLPESPRFDYRSGSIDQARRNMARFYGIPENHNRILEELEEIREQQLAEYQEEKWYEFLTAPRMFFRIALGMVLQSLQQLTGANYFFYYGTTIMQGAGISNSFVTQVIFGAVNFVTAFGGLYVVENFGRRMSLMVGAGCMFVCFMAFASVGHFAFDHLHPENTPGAGKGMVILACFFITSFAMTWGPITWAICAEIFPAKYRAKGMALSTASNWLWNFLIGFCTPFITTEIDFAYGYVFASCLFCGVFFVYFCIIEGHGRTLEEVDWMYVNQVAPWQSKSYKIPQHHEVTSSGYSQKKNNVFHTENI